MFSKITKLVAPAANRRMNIGHGPGARMDAGATRWESTSGPQIKSQAQQGSQTAADSHARPLRVLWAGEPELARDHLAQEAPHMQFTAVPTTPEQLSRALGNLDSGAEPRFDVLVIDISSPDFNPISALQEARARGLDVPVLLLIQPGDEKKGAQALNAGADDYIIKTSGYVRRLLPALESLVFRHEPARANEVRGTGRDPSQVDCRVSTHLRDGGGERRTSLCD